MRLSSCWAGEFCFPIVLFVGKHSPVCSPPPSERSVARSIDLYHTFQTFPCLLGVKSGGANFFHQNNRVIFEEAGVDDTGHVIDPSNTFYRLLRETEISLMIGDQLVGTLFHRGYRRA